MGFSQENYKRNKPKYTVTLAIIHRECTLTIKSLFYIKCSRMCVWYFCFSLLVLGTYCSGGGTEETSDEDRNGDGNGSIWWTAVALFTLRGTLLQMFRGKAGKGWRRTRAEGCEWLEVWWFVTRPPFGFWWVAHVGCVRQQDGHIVGHDGETLVRWRGPKRSMASGCEKKNNR